MNVVGMHTQTVKGKATMTFTVEVSDSGRLSKVLGLVPELPGVKSARRRCPEKHADTSKIALKGDF